MIKFRYVYFIYGFTVLFIEKDHAEKQVRFLKPNKVLLTGFLTLTYIIGILVLGN